MTLCVCVFPGSLKYWKRQGEQPKPVNSWYYYAAPSAEVEMTSYALLATLEYYKNDSVAMGQPIAFWLSNQQSAFGGYSSTQVSAAKYINSIRVPGVGRQHLHI